MEEKNGKFTGKNYKLIIFASLLFVFVMIIFTFIFFNNLINKTAENKITGDFIVNDSEGVLVKQDANSKTYYKGNGTYEAVISSKHSKPEQPELEYQKLEGSYSPDNTLLVDPYLIDPYLYPTFQGGADDTTLNVSPFNGVGWTVAGVYTNGLFKQKVRGWMFFAKTNISINSTIVSATLTFEVVHTDLASTDSVEIRQENSSYVLFNNYDQDYLAIGFGGASRSFGVLTGTDVSTLGVKTIALNSNAIAEIQKGNGLDYVGFGLGFNSTGAENNAAAKYYYAIDYGFNSTRPYITIAYTTNNANDSAQTMPTPIYDLNVNATIGAAPTTTPELTIGNPTGAVPDTVALITFNLSSIPDNADIQQVVSRINVTNITVDSNPTVWYYAADDQLQFRSTNSSLCVTNKYPANNASLYTNVTGGQLMGYSYTVGRGLLDTRLFIFTRAYFKQQVSNGCITMGVLNPDPANEGILNFSSSEGNFPPELHVTYAYSNCSVPPNNTADWEIKSYCLVNNQQVVLNKDLVISTPGFLNMTGTTNVTFNKSNSKIYVYSGGQINLYNSAGFCKK